MKLFSLFVIAILLLQAFTEASGAQSLTQVDETGEGALFKKVHHGKINCSHACARRCRLASRKKMCTRACKTCCARCHCVPPGTYGNKNTCPCYARQRTHGNRPKCP